MLDPLWQNWRGGALPDTLLARPYRDRVAAVRTLALAAAAGDTASDTVIEALSRGGAHERRLAASSLPHHPVPERLLRLSADASRFVWGAAAKALVARGSPEDLDEGLRAAWETARHVPILRWALSRGRHAEIGRFVAWMAERPGEAKWVDWVSAGDEETLRRLLPRALERPSAKFWTRLGRHRPAVAVEVFGAALAARPGPPDGMLRVVLESSLPRLASAEPDATLVLAGTLLDRGATVPEGAWTALLAARPDAALHLGWAHGRRWTTRLGADAAKALPLATIQRLLDEGTQLLPEPRDWLPKRTDADRAAIVDAWLGVLPRHPKLLPGLFEWVRSDAGDRRDAAYVAWSRANRDTEGILSIGLAAVLPLDLRRREALRHLHEVAALATRPLQRMEWMKFLAYEDVAPLLRDYLGHPEPEIRGPAVATLIQVCGRDASRPELAAEGLKLVLARKFEQDPVRQQMFTALKGWPEAVWRVEHLPALAQAFRDALDAADLSWGTHTAMEAVLLQRFGLDAAWATAQLLVFLRERGQLVDTDIGARLPGDRLLAALPALTEVTTTWRAQERWDVLIRVIGSLGKRIVEAPALADRLVDVAMAAQHAYYAVRAMNGIVAHDAERREARGPEVAARWLERGWDDPVVELVEKTTTPGPHEATLLAIVKRAGTIHRFRSIRAQKQLQRIGPAALDAALKVVRGEGWSVLELANLAVALDPPPPSVVDLLVGQWRRDHADRVASALNTLRRPRPAVFEALATDVLTRDASAIAIPIVCLWAHYRATHLLDPALGGTRVEGRWATGRTSWIFTFGRGQFRWTPAQQETWAANVTPEIGNDERDTPARLTMLNDLPELPWLARTPLHTLAGSTTPVIRERATRLLGRVDEGSGVPTLLECLADDRARWAIYALRRGLTGVPAARAATVLLQAPRRQVTVAKEVVRLLGELRGEAGFRALVGLWSTNLHRDVRIALLRGLWAHLERDETWTIYEAAATAPDHVLASRLGDVPADYLTVTSDRRLSALYARVVDRPEPEARIEALRRAPALALRDADRALLRACLSRVDSIYVDEIQAAVEAVTARLHETDTVIVAELAPRVAPNRRALGALLGRWNRSFPNQASRALRAAYGAALDTLLPDPQLVAHLLGNALTCWGPAEWVTRVDAAAERGHLHPAALASARALVTGLDRPTAATAWERWSVAPDPGRRLLALAALEREVALAGWSPETRARLTTIQSDVDPMVAGEARWVLPPSESGQR